jgi:hypothetical protein
LAGEGEGAAVGSVGTGDDLDECRFARAVFTEEGVDFAGPEVEIDSPQSADPTVVLHELTEFEERSG